MCQVWRGAACDTSRFRRTPLTYSHKLCKYIDMNKPSDILRAAIKKSGIPNYRLAKATGVSRIVIINFLAGGNITARNFDPLCEHFGLELRPKKKR